jgi:hypothetical protein
MYDGLADSPRPGPEAVSNIADARDPLILVPASYTVMCAMTRAVSATLATAMTDVRFVPLLATGVAFRARTVWRM